MQAWHSAVVVAALATVAPPHAVTVQLPKLEAIGRFSDLPVAVREGRFTVDGVSAAGWKMAEPGAPFSSTDVPVAGAPGRRLIFAACDAQLCVIHYERGGIAHFYELLALVSSAKGWTAVWNVRGNKPIPNLTDLRAMLQHGSLDTSWSLPGVKGDF